MNLTLKNSMYSSTCCHLYNYCSNNPIKYIDPDGRIERKADKSFVFYPYSEAEYVVGNSEQLILVQWGYIKANDGTLIKVRINFSDVRQEKFNCHGYTFTNGAAWIQPNQVPHILEGDGYKEIDKPEAGGIFVQYDEKGEAWHSGKIKSVDNEKNTIVVQEAMGVAIFKRKDGKLYDTIIQTYDITSMGIVKFYKNEGDKIIEDTK